MDNRRPLGFIFMVGVVLAAMCCGCRREIGQTPIPVQALKLERETITSELRFSATVRERQRIELSFKVPGTVASLLQIIGPDGTPHDVHEGDSVMSEKPLAQLDDSDYKRRVAGAKDQLAQVEAKQQAAAATVKAVQAKYERIKSLRDRGSVSQQSFDDILANRDASAAELEAARRQGGGAATALQQAEDDLAHCSLRLPIPTAVVSRKFIERGERVPAGQPVLEVMDLSQLRVAFGVPDTRVGKFQLGQSVAVSADAFRGERFSGRVTKIAPAADLRTRSFEVEVTIEQPRMLRPGMVVTIIVGRREEMTLTPMTAVQRGDNPNEFVVFAVVDEGGRKIARRRTVKIDGVYDNRIRLEEDKESGVGLGDMIVVTGAFRLADGLEVRVVDVPKAAIRIDEK